MDLESTINIFLIHIFSYMYIFFMYVFCICRFPYTCIHVSCFLYTSVFHTHGSCLPSFFSLCSYACHLKLHHHRENAHTGSHRRNGLGICQPSFSPLVPSLLSHHGTPEGDTTLLRSVTQYGLDLQWWGQAAQENINRIRKRRGGERGNMGMGKAKINTSNWRKFP